MMKIFAILSLLVCLAFTKSSAPNVGEQAPNFEIEASNGKKISLKNFKGKLVLIDFWASWCGPCRKENPNVVEAYGKYKKKKFKNAKGFEVLSISLDKNEEAWKKAMTDDALVWNNHAIDKEGKVASLYSVRSIPSGFLLDGKGKIIASGQALRGLGLHIEIEKQLK